MAWIRFIADMDFKPRPSVTIAYKAGMVVNVTSACAAEAVRKKRGVRQRKPSRNAVPADADQGEG